MIFVYICRFSLYVTFYFHNVKHEVLVKRWNLGVPGGQILLRGQNLWVTSIWTRLESPFFGIQKWENWYKIHQDTRICQFIGCPENPSFVFYDPQNVWSFLRGDYFFPGLVVFRFVVAAIWRWKSFQAEISKALSSTELRDDWSGSNMARV